MAKKLKFKVAVGALHDIITEGEHNAHSGDVRLAASGRHNVLLGTILLTLISDIGEDNFNDTKLERINKKDLADALVEETEEENNSDEPEEE